MALSQQRRAGPIAGTKTFVGLNVMREIPPPRATRDYLPEEATARRQALARFTQTAEAYGFQPIETPSYERVELFLARSGSEIKNSLLTFHCDHEEFALRPELTAPVCRLLATGELDALPKPYKLYYTGSCFRYVRPGSGRLREFTQAGLELLGEAGPSADAEVIAAASRFLREAGLGKASLKIGSVGIFRALLPDAADSEDSAIVIGHLDLLAGIRERCAQFDGGEDRQTLNELRIDRKQLAEMQHRTGYEGEYSIADHADIDTTELAKRLPLEAEATLRTVWAVEDLVTEKRAETLIKVSRLRGSLADVIEQAKDAVANTPATAALDNLAEVCRLLALYGLQDFEVVLGIARGLTFYTGIVFEFTADGTTYGGGGRYDDLAALFGAEPTPAVGCAFRFDAVLQALSDTGAQSAYQLFLTADAANLSAAIQIAEELRDQGIRVGVGSSAPADGLADNVGSVTGNGVEFGGAKLADADAIVAQLAANG